MRHAFVIYRTSDFIITDIILLLVHDYIKFGLPDHHERTTITFALYSGNS